MKQQEQKDRFNELVRKKGAVFGKFPEQRPSTLSRVQCDRDDSDDEITTTSSSSRSKLLGRQRLERTEFKSPRATKLTTAERFVDNMGALHRIPTKDDTAKTVADTRSFGERLRDFFLFIDPNKV
jgi:hypothetical protein